MKTQLLWPFAAATTASFVAATAAAQRVTTRTLTKPEAEFAEPFSQLNAAYELKDGRVIVADLRDKTLQAIDVATGKATSVGREGAGPQEWNTVLSLWGWKGDSVLANDFGNGRYLVIAPDGKPVRTFTTAGDGAIVAGTPSSSAGRGAGAGSAGGGAGGRGAAGRGNAGRQGPGARGVPRLSSGAPAHGVDSRGRIYSQGMAFSIGDDGRIVSSDSAPILRLDPATGTTDTIAFVNLAKNSVSGSVSGGGSGRQSVQIRVGGGSPFPSADDWSVFRDGTVAILRVADYHLELIKPTGRRIVGRPVAFTPVKVGEAEKQEWRDRLKGATPIVRTTGGNGSRSTAVPMAMPVQEPDSWPATKPPFLGGGASAAAFPAPNGDLWVARTRAAADRIPTIDVFNSQAQLIGRVMLPEKTRLVALGAKGVYTARIDEDDLQYLQRHAMQWTGCAPEVREVCGR
jgi:hypothetical protein